MKKTPGDIIILHKCTKIHDHMLYCSWHVVRDRCNCYFSFWAIFCPFTPITAQKMKIFKNEKNTSWYHHFTHVFQKLWLDDVLLLRYGARETDGQTNGRTDGKSDTERWLPHLKILSVALHISETIIWLPFKYTSVKWWYFQ